MPETQEQEWRRLTELYREMYDEQLLDLATSFNDLREMAQTVLRDELRTRELGDPLAPDFSALAKGRADAQHALDAPQDETATKPTDYTWKTSLCESESREEAWQIREALRRAGIESWLRDPTRYFATPHLDLTNYQIQVAADQLEEARAVIANPIPQDIVDDSRLEIPEYKPPICPACQAPDPILMAADPSNSWECESCGNEWSDPVDGRPDAP